MATGNITYNGEALTFESQNLTFGGPETQTPTETITPTETPTPTETFTETITPTETPTPTSSGKDFGFSAEEVALITQNFDTVENYLRLRNQGQI